MSLTIPGKNTADNIENFSVECIFFLEQYWPFSLYDKINMTTLRLVYLDQVIFSCEGFMDHIYHIFKHFFENTFHFSFFFQIRHNQNAILKEWSTLDKSVHSRQKISFFFPIPLKWNSEQRQNIRNRKMNF